MHTHARTHAHTHSHARAWVYVCKMFTPVKLAFFHTFLAYLTIAYIFMTCVDLNTNVIIPHYLRDSHTWYQIHTLISTPLIHIKRFVWSHAAHVSRGTPLLVGQGGGPTRPQRWGPLPLFLFCTFSSSSLLFQRDHGGAGRQRPRVLMGFSPRCFGPTWTVFVEWSCFPCRRGSFGFVVYVCKTRVKVMKRNVWVIRHSAAD